eukprot:SAG31_NODE_457_length_15415_cov_4.380387_16_plen_74_part_00
MLFRIVWTLVGLLGTGVPIMIGLRPDINEEFARQNSTVDEVSEIVDMRRVLVTLVAEIASLKELVKNGTQDSG